MNKFELSLIEHKLRSTQRKQLLPMLVNILVLETINMYLSGVANMLRPCIRKVNATLLSFIFIDLFTENKEII